MSVDRGDLGLGKSFVLGGLLFALFFFVGFVGGMLVFALDSRAISSRFSYPPPGDSTASEGTKPMRGDWELRGIEVSLGVGAGREGSWRSTFPWLRARGEGRPRVAIVIDDFGFSVGVARQFLELPFPVTWAIIPFRPHSGEVARIARLEGIPFLVHMPMEAWGDSKRYPNVLRVGMREEEVEEAVERALSSLPGAEGMNNHRGSLATEDRRLMGYLMRALSRRGLYFLDSMTTPRTVAFRAAREEGLGWALNDLFLDNEPEEEAIALRMRQLASMALRRGSAVGICHARPQTYSALLRNYRIFEEMGVELVHLRDLISRGGLGLEGKR